MSVMLFPGVRRVSLDAATQDVLLARATALEARVCQTLSLPVLMAMWDSYDGAVTFDPLISGEAVHAELNRRGFGGYCAV